MTPNAWRFALVLALSPVATGCGDEVRATAAGACEARLGEMEWLATVDWRAFAVGAGYAYYPVDDAVVRVAVTGGEPETWIAGAAPSRLRVIGAHLYWLDADTLWRRPLAGGDAESVISAAEIGAYDVRDGVVYWAHDRPAPVPDPARPVDVHENEEPIATLEKGGRSYGLFAEPEGLLVWNGRSSDPATMHRLERVEAGGEVTAFASREGMMDTAVRDGTVYWLGAELSYSAPEQVWARDLDGAEEPRVVADAASLFEEDTYGAQLHTVAAGAEHLFYSGFWHGDGDSQPMVVAQCHDGESVATARIPGEPRNMAVDDDAVYVSGQDIYRIPILR